jgi:tripartite-type tricarboxylate transporter receptor subunit TctC
LNASLVRALNEPDVHTRLKPLAQKPAPGTPAEFGSYIRSQYLVWGKAVKATGAKVN